MTHFLDTSATLAHYFREPGASRVQALFDDPTVGISISVLSLIEIATAVANRTGDERLGESVAALYERAVDVIVPVTRDVVALALDLRRDRTARIALADLLIAATAALHGATLVHRDPHFDALPSGRPAQERLPDKA